jgi:hypothetical protein
MKTFLQAGGMADRTETASVACSRPDSHLGGRNGPAEDIFPPQRLVELFKISFYHPNVQKSLQRALVERRVGRSRWGLVETPID